MRRAHLFGTKPLTAQPIRTLPALKGREERDGKGRSKEWGVDCWWLVAERERETVRKRKWEGEMEKERGREEKRQRLCGAGRRRVISQTDEFQSSAKAKSRGY